MRKKTLLLSLMGAALLLGGNAAAVLAHDGHEHREVAQYETNRASVENENTGRKNAAERQADRSKRAQEFHQKGQELIGELKQDRKARGQAERQRICQSRKQGLQTKLDNLAKNAAAHKTRIDNVLSKAVTYQESHNIQVENFEALMASAAIAQTTAQNSVEALQSLKPTVDCNNESVASDVAAFKVAAAQARTDLTDYRQSVKAILRALKSGNEGGQN